MAGLQLSGLASGFDWKSVVDQLIELQRVPQTRLSSEKSNNNTKLTTFSTLRTKLTNLEAATKALSADSVFDKRTVSTSDSTLGWNVTAGSGAVAGAYRIDVSKLATQTTRTGATGVSGSIANSNDVSELLVSEMKLTSSVSDGFFTVNGARVEVSGTDSLQDVFDRISSATGGAVTASYDSASDKVTLSGSGPVTLGSGVDTSNFLYALELFNNGGTSVTSATRIGTISLDDSLADAGLAGALSGVDEDGNGSFAVNGETIAYNIETDSLRSLMSRVNQSAAGVLMSYDSGQDRFVLANRSTGDVGMAATDTEGTLLQALGLGSSANVVRGTNAEFSVNGGGTIVSASNALTAEQLGVPGLSVTATKEGSQTVTVSTDTKSVDTAVRSFISAFNDVQSYINIQTDVSVSSNGTVRAATLAGNQELSSMGRELRGLAFGAVSGMESTISRLESIGIDFSGNSAELSVRDEAKLANALSGNLEEVSKLFSGSAVSIGSRMTSYIERVTGTSGTLDIQVKSIERQNRSLDTQIADIERRLEAERTRLEASFIAMEEAQSLMSSQLAALNGALGSS
jgi:flagellar hook-associated protein 2